MFIQRKSKIELKSPVPILEIETLPSLYNPLPPWLIVPLPSPPPPTMFWSFVLVDLVLRSTYFLGLLKTTISRDGTYIDQRRLMHQLDRMASGAHAPILFSLISNIRWAYSINTRQVASIWTSRGYSQSSLTTGRAAYGGPLASPFCLLISSSLLAVDSTAPFLCRLSFSVDLISLLQAFHSL